MLLNKQVFFPCVDTSAFFTDEERDIEVSLNEARRRKREYKGHDSQVLKENRDAVKEGKARLLAALSSHNGVRELRPEYITDRCIISSFESALTRAVGARTSEVTYDLITLRVYYFDVFHDLIHYGFVYRGDRYVFLTASAGQIRTKRAVFVREKTWNSVSARLMGGLTVEEINQKGGINCNKYLSYLALCNSATERWEGFDIDRCIVVDDFTTVVRGTVDFIDEKTCGIERKEMDIPITHTDGCGMMLPRVSNRNFMVRAPWLKGLLAVFPFDRFINQSNEAQPHRDHAVVTDIWGEQHHIFDENIQVIFTKSQLKLWKFYDSWDDYKARFKENGCEASYCNIEDPNPPLAKLNYQILQTLTDMTDAELETICHKTNRELTRITTDVKTMLRVLGATERNPNKNDFQKCLLAYPELLRDGYCKNALVQMRKSIERGAWAGKIETNGRYTFLIPDLYAFCEHLFGGPQLPRGLLDAGEVYCRLYPADEEVDCLRSPHLYREHCIRRNVAKQRPELREWFVTSGLYTSTHDLISKVLQFDNDGDISLVVADPTIRAAAKRSNEGIVPLYYQMAKAGATQITPDALYNGMILAYTGGNIGSIANAISKIWNSPQPSLDAVKLLTCKTNFTIDYAKTLYQMFLTPSANRLISSFTKAKLPHFFRYAKNKKRSQVEKANGSTVNRIREIVKRRRLNFNVQRLGPMDYRMLMSNPKTRIDETVISQFCELSQKVKARIFSGENGDSNYAYLYNNIRSALCAGRDPVKVTDMLILQLFVMTPTTNKAVFWNCFGDVVLENIRLNLQGTIRCQKCGLRFTPSFGSNKLCPSCSAL